MESVLARYDYIEPFPACSLITHLLGYHILYHYNEGVVERRTYKLLANIFSEAEKINV